MSVYAGDEVVSEHIHEQSFDLALLNGQVLDSQRNSLYWTTNMYSSVHSFAQLGSIRQAAEWVAVLL